MGSLFHLPVVSVDRITDCLRGLRKSGYRVVASSLSDAETLQGYEWPRKTALVVGNEARGVSDVVYEIADTRLRIPKTGKAESLNAAMAASVMLGHWRMGV